MCIAYFEIGHPDWPLFIAANRDEFHHRPAQAARPWKNHSDIIAGLDIEAGGTWLGITRKGRFGFLTNYREPGVSVPHAPSRGKLVSDWLIGTQSLTQYTDALRPALQQYNGFNLIVGNLQACHYVSNRSQAGIQTLNPGQYVISNHLLNTAWPKTEHLRAVFKHTTQQNIYQSLDDIFALLKDTTPASDASLPTTGLSLEFERLLSSPFIISPNYGTRCSTIVAFHRSGQGIFSEVSYDPKGNAVARHDWPLTLDMPASH